MIATVKVTLYLKGFNTEMREYLNIDPDELASLAPDMADDIGVEWSDVVSVSFDIDDPIGLSDNSESENNG